MTFEIEQAVDELMEQSRRCKDCGGRFETYYCPECKKEVRNRCLACHQDMEHELLPPGDNVKLSPPRQMPKPRRGTVPDFHDQQYHGGGYSDW